ncbi:hypothetical protein E2C01_037602 [Portunus trituberculatus]|uniref:Uncharacterized protein n=1 Tax=Portunus trituberculatus TaxID=210409 RepID=A0A5B7FHH4_PORTR|nr:hypothetical protein [Portunus trituberculatus]
MSTPTSQPERTTEAHIWQTNEPHEEVAPAKSFMLRKRQDEAISIMLSSLTGLRAMDAGSSGKSLRNTNTKLRFGHTTKGRQDSELIRMHLQW